MSRQAVMARRANPGPCGAWGIAVPIASDRERRGSPMTHAASRIGIVLAAALAAYLLLCLGVYARQRSLLYFPWRWSEEEARRANPGYEEVRFRAEDGESLHGWLLRNPGAPWTVIVFHGNGGNLSVQADLMDPFERLGLQVLLFDYRGYGLSTGNPTEAGLVADGLAAAKFAADELRVPPERIVYYGKSIGAGVAALAGARRPPGRLILESSFDSMAALGAYHYPFLPVRWFLRDRFDAASVIGAIRCPILFIHGDADEIVPIARGRALFEAADLSGRRFLVLPGARHNDPPSTYPPAYLETVKEFLKGEAPPRGAGGAPARP